MAIEKMPKEGGRTKKVEKAADEPDHGKALAVAAEALPPKIVKTSEELSCELNDVEWQNRARDLAEANQEVEIQEQRKKDINKELSADVSTAKSKASKLTTIVATRREQRDVTVVIKYDYELGRVTKTRTDNNEVLSDREMTDDERQQQLDLQDANSFIEGRHEEPELPEDVNLDEIDEKDLDE